MDEAEPTESDASEVGKAKTPRKVIKGNLPSTPASGVFKKTLDGLIAAGQPERFTPSFMETILGVTGGSSRYVPPLLKKMGFLTSDSAPTDLYSSFRTDGSRSAAAFVGLKSAFGELFQRNEFIHKASEPEVRDHIVAITGLPKSDPYVGYIFNTFKVVRDFISGDPSMLPKVEPPSNTVDLAATSSLGASNRVGLINNINIVLPESTNITVYNLIFQSLRANLLG